MKISITTHFDAAHHLPNYDGPCSRVHGHRWVVRVVFEGPVDKKTGMVTDFTWLKSGLKPFIDRHDHTDLNQIYSMPTAENIAKQLHDELEAQLRYGSVRLKSIRIYETPECYVEVP